VLVAAVGLPVGQVAKLVAVAVAFAQRHYPARRVRYFIGMFPLGRRLVEHRLQIAGRDFKLTLFQLLPVSVDFLLTVVMVKLMVMLALVIVVALARQVVLAQRLKVAVDRAEVLAAVVVRDQMGLVMPVRLVVVTLLEAMVAVAIMLLVVLVVQVLRRVKLALIVF
jgi:hypothetical protein